MKCPVFYAAYRSPGDAFVGNASAPSEAAAGIPEGPGQSVSTMGVSPIVTEAVREAVGCVSYLVEVLLILDSIPVALLG